MSSLNISAAPLCPSGYSFPNNTCVPEHNTLHVAAYNIGSLFRSLADRFFDYINPPSAHQIISDSPTQSTFKRQIVEISDASLEVLKIAPEAKISLELSEGNPTDSLVIEGAKLQLTYAPKKTLKTHNRVIRAAKIAAIVVETRISKQSSDTPTTCFKELAPSQNKIIDEVFEYINDGVSFYESSHVRNLIEDDVIALRIDHVSYDKHHSGTLEGIQRVLKTFQRQVDSDNALQNTPQAMKIFDTLETSSFDNFALIKRNVTCTPITSKNNHGLLTYVLQATYSSNTNLSTPLLTKLFEKKHASFAQAVLSTLLTKFARGTHHSVSKNHHTIDGGVYVVERKEPLRIVHCQNDEELKENSSLQKLEFDAMYSPKENVLSFKTCADFETTERAFVHEAAHALMNIVFQNNAKPYFADDTSSKEAYQAACKEVFVDILDTLGIKADNINTLEKIAINVRDNHKKERVLQHIETLNLPEHENKILRDFASLAFDYDLESLEAELIVRLPQFDAENIPYATFVQYFKPLIQYWNTHITLPSLA